MTDLIREQLDSVLVVLGAVRGQGAVLVASATNDLVKKGYNAGDIVKQVSQKVGGGGGGKADFAHAGIHNKGKLDEALSLVKKLI